MSYCAYFNPALALYTNISTSLLISTLKGSSNSPNDCIVDDLYNAGRWPDMYTLAEPANDRVEPHLLRWASAAYLGSYTERSKFNPMLAVSWEGFSTNYAALVFNHRKDSLSVAVYSFNSIPVTGAMRIWELEHGNYQVKIGSDRNQDFVIDSFTSISTNELAKGDTVGLTLPPQQVTMLVLTQLSELDSIFDRADLAWAAREISVSNNIVTGIVHNIGARAVTNVVAAAIR